MTKSRRAISGIITSLMLLAITVVGGIIAWVLISDTNVIGGLSENVESGKKAKAVKIVGFDTRNGCALSGIGGLDNVTGACASTDADGEKLCTTSCTANGNREDSIVINVRNITFKSIQINTLEINEVSHIFDTDSVGNVVGTGGTVPDTGEFSIIPNASAGSLLQFSSPEIKAGQDVRLVITLDSTVNGADDIELTEQIRINIRPSDFEFDRFIIPAGTAR